MQLTIQAGAMIKDMTIFRQNPREQSYEILRGGLSASFGFMISNWFLEFKS